MRRYRGDYRELAELASGGVLMLKKPDDLTPEQFARTVRNAATHFGSTRCRRFTVRSTKTGGVEVTRVMTKAEFEQWTLDTAPKT